MGKSPSLRKLPGIILLLGFFSVLIFSIAPLRDSGSFSPDEFYVPDRDEGDAAFDFALPLIADPEHPLGYPGEDFPEFRLSERETPFVLLDFWADWCGPCIPKLSVLAGIREEYRNRGFEVYGVLHTFPTWRARKWFGVNGGAPFPQVQDELRSVAKAYDVISLPHMVLLDEASNIVWACRGCGGIEEHLPRTLDSLFNARGRLGAGDSSPTQWR